ncbi:hypothetical protein BH11VER1_BH11VER1_36700 [soil metagenome]
MKEVFNHQEFERVGLCQSILDEAGIPSFIRNEISNNLITGLPSPLFAPALFVIEDADYEKAMEIIAALQDATPSPASDWSCPKCGESVPGNFDTCWQCETARQKTTENMEEH